MKKNQRKKRAHARRRQRGKNRNRMDEALIKNPEHDIHRHQRRKNQQRHIRQRVPERCCRPLEIRLQARRHVHVLLHLRDLRNRPSQSGVRRKIERDRYRRKLSLMRDRKRLCRRLEVREGAERHCVAVGRACCSSRGRPPARGRRGSARCERIDRRRKRIRRGRKQRRGGQRVRASRSRTLDRRGRRSCAAVSRSRIRLDIQMVQLIRIQLELRLCLQNHVILIQLRIHRVDLTLAKCVIQRIVDRRWRNAQPRRSGAVDHQRHRKAAHLLVRRDVFQLRQLLQSWPQNDSSNHLARSGPDPPACTDTASGSRGRRP